MNLHTLESEIQEMGSWWHKLIFICNLDLHVQEALLKGKNFEVFNINLKVSEALIGMPVKDYPLYIEEILQTIIRDSNKVNVLQHIDVLFDPALKVNPVRLLENLSKRYKLVVFWPGTFTDGKLTYAESGHPEFFTCDVFEGKIIEG